VAKLVAQRLRVSQLAKQKFIEKTSKKDNMGHFLPFNR